MKLDSPHQRALQMTSNLSVDNTGSCRLFRALDDKLGIIGKQVGLPHHCLSSALVWYQPTLSLFTICFGMLPTFFVTVYQLLWYGTNLFCHCLSSALVWYQPTLSLFTICFGMLPTSFCHCLSIALVCYQPPLSLFKICFDMVRT